MKIQKEKFPESEQKSVFMDRNYVWTQRFSKDFVYLTHFVFAIDVVLSNDTCGH